MPFVGFSTLPSGSSGCAREIGRSEVVGWKSVQPPSSLSTLSLLEMKDKHWVHNLLFTRLVGLFTQGSSCSHGKGFFMASFWGLLLFSQKGKVCNLSRAEWITWGHSLEGLSLQDGRWLSQQHRVSESSAEQPWSRKELWVLQAALSLCGGAGTARATLPMPGAIVVCSSGLHSRVFPGSLDTCVHWPGPILGLGCVLKQRWCCDAMGGL